MSTAIIAMGLDMFGFSVIVTGASCDFQLDHAQKSILLSMPFGGKLSTRFMVNLRVTISYRKLTKIIKSEGGI